MISICVPTYNRLTQLKCLLDSIFNRFGDYPYEVIIADGGSTDGTLEYLKNLDFDNIKLIEQGELTGAVKAFNACAKIAEGDYILSGCDDIVVVPKVLIKACKLMDEEEQIGLVAPKMQESTYGNLHAVGLIVKQYSVLFGKAHLYRSSLLKDIDYWDESFRTYYVDMDAFLSIMKLGYTTIFTREVAIVHSRFREKTDDSARAVTTNIMKSRQETEYLMGKWKDLQVRSEECSCHSPLKRYRAIFFERACEIMYYAKWLCPFVEKNNKLAMKLFDWFLERAAIFKDKRYDHLKDFYLAQKYPEEIISSLE